MDLHKPRPWHGVREFLKEYLIVVVGVLTALGAEQVVEWVHRQSEVREAREAIRQELALNFAYLRSRDATRACVDRRLGEVQAILDAARPDGAFKRPGWVGRPQFWSIETLRWDAASQSGRAALLPPNEMASYGSVYTQLRLVMAEMAIEQGDWARLRSLENQQRLPPPGVYDMNLILNDARYRAWRIALITTQEFADARPLRIAEVTNPNAAPQSVCVPITATRAQGQQMSRFPFGEP